MKTASLRARLGRIDALAAGLRAEVFLWPRRGGPLLAHERREYLEAIASMCDGVERARESLAQASERLAEPQIPAPGVKVPKGRGCR